MSRFGLITKRCKRPNTSELDCYKKQYVDGQVDVTIWGEKYSGQGVYIQVLDPYTQKEKWYELVYKHTTECGFK